VSLSRSIILSVCAAVPVVASAQGVGNGTNYQSPNAPNYQAPIVPPPPNHELPSVPSAPTQPAPAGTGGQLFVKKIEVRGVKAFKPDLIHKIVAPYENRVVSAAELWSLRAALAKLYVDNGYINSGVLLPDQEAADGRVVFQAIEAALTRVEVADKGHLNPRYIKWRLRDHVSDPLKMNDLQYAIHYLQQDPNIQRLDARFSPGEVPGQGVLRLEVEDQPRFSAGLGFDNHHTSTTGANEGTAFFGARDLTGFGDEIHGTVIRARGDTEGSGVVSVPIAADDAAFQVYYARSSAGIIEQPFESLNIEETTRTYGFSVTVPLLNRPDDRVSLFVGAESDRSYTQLLDQPFSLSQGAQNGVSAAAVVLGGVDWTLHGATSVTDLRLTYRRGIDALGATINSNDTDYGPNPTGADGRFGLEQMQFIFIQRLNAFSPFSALNDRAQFIARASGQLSQRPLLLLEQFSVGGVDTVRGFSENLLVRDNGTAETLEIQVPVPGYRAQPNWRNLLVAPFVDYGRSWDKANEDPGNPLLDTTHPLYIASAGAGLLWNPLKGLDAQVYYGKSIANNFNSSDDPRNFAPDDLQKRGVYFAVNYVAHW